MNKREARDILFTLVYEYEFNPEKSASEIYGAAIDERGFENFRYIKKGLSDIISKRDYLTKIIEDYSDGWKVSRIAPVTRAILFVAIYDMVLKSTAAGIAINEAVELSKKYDEEAATPFINGILNAVAQNIDSVKASVVSDTAENEAEPENEA